MNENIIKQINLNGVDYDIQSNELTKVTYAELKEIRDNSGLTAGHLYRITDYMFTTKQTDTKSAGHPFDVIVLATAENQLSELARAIQREGDTYFDGNDLGAWELWYDLDNDTNKYEWADTENGKGVIYRMIDEKRNDCPYDFKNIMFYENKYTENVTEDNYYYTFSYVIDSVLYDGTVESQVKSCYGNSMREYLSSISNKQYLNKSAFRNTSFGTSCHDNTFGYNCTLNTFGNGCYGNTFGNGCYGNTFGNECYNNIFREICYRNTFGDSCQVNTFGENYQDNTFGDRCYRNTFGGSCGLNTFGDNYQDNTFGNSCSNNTFGNYYKNINLENNCQYITLNSTSTTSSSNYLQNIKVTNGLSGTKAAELTITAEPNSSRNLVVTKDTNNNIIQYYDGDFLDKQDIIEDLEIIRSGAAAGATALQTKDLEGYATEEYVGQKIVDLVDGAPETLDTLNELSAALKDNAGIVDVLNESIGKKQDVLVSGESIKTINGESLLGEGNIEINGDNITSYLNIKDTYALEEIWNSLTERGEKGSFIITDEGGSYPSFDSKTVYIDNEDLWMDLFYRANGDALKYLVKSPEAYYKIGGKWSSKNISDYVRLPKYHLQTAKVGDIITIIRQEFTAEEFYANYIDYSLISFRDSLSWDEKLLFESFLALNGISTSLSDGEIIKQMIIKGLVCSCPTNPEKTGDIPVPLAIDGNVVLYTAHITPNTQNIYNGEFWTGNMTGPGIYSYVTAGRPDGSEDGEFYIGYVSPNGTQSLVSMINPYKVFVRLSINDEWINVTEQIFGDILHQIVEISSKRFPSIPGWLTDVDNCLDNGVHPTCSTQSILYPSRSSISAPSDLKWSNGYFTCLVNRTSTNDGTYDTIEQTAYGRDADAGQIYKRIIFQGPDTQYGPWINIVSGGTGTYPEINHGTSDTTFTLTPNTFHIWGEVPSLYISFAPEIEGIANEYIFQFSSGSIPTELNIDGNVKWADIPNMSANKTYQISVLKGLASIMEFS